MIEQIWMGKTSARQRAKSSHDRFWTRSADLHTGPRFPEVPHIEA